MAFTCFSNDHLGCGANHRTLGIAEKCCSVHERKYNEARKPIRVATNSEIAPGAKYAPSTMAAARRDAWRAATADSRRAYNGGVDLEGNDGSKDEHGATTSTSTSLAQEAAQTQAAQGEAQEAAQTQAAQGEAQEAAQPPAAQEAAQAIPPPADPADPMALMAKALVPHLAEPLGEILIPAIAGAAAKAAKDAVGSEAMERATKAVDTKLAEVDEKLANLETARRIEVFTPDATEGIEIEGCQHEHLELLLKLVGAGENVFMSGPAGSGKTTAASTVAKALGMELIIQPVATDKFDALGFVDAGGTYRESAVYRWAKSEKPALLLIDEMDAWLPQALVALNPILDNRVGIFPNGQFEISHHHRVISTANTWGLGADSDYCGRNRLDAASLDRFGARLDWGYDENFETKIITATFGKEIARKVLPLSLSIRKALSEQGVKIVWGPRQTIGLAKRLAAGISLETALQVSALAAVPEQSRKRVLGEAKKQEASYAVKLAK